MPYMVSQILPAVDENKRRLPLCFPAGNAEGHDFQNFNTGSYWERSDSIIATTPLILCRKCGAVLDVQFSAGEKEEEDYGNTNQCKRVSAC